MKDYYYHINLNERGCFYADVRDQNDKTIYEIKNNEDGQIEIIEDGYMKNILDLDGLEKYLRQLGFISKQSIIYLGE